MGEGVASSDGTMTLTQFAKWVEVTPPAITKAIKQGRIKSARKVGNSWRIDARQARVEFEGNRATKDADGDWNHLRSERLKIQIKRDEFELEREMGKYVSAEEVSRRISECVNRIRDLALAMPDREAAELSPGEPPHVRKVQLRRIQQRFCEEVARVFGWAGHDSDAG